MMATAEDYAHWIVANQDKKGTPEFDTVAKAYQVARQAPAAPTPQAKPDESLVTKVIGGAVEPNLQMLSGMVAQPAAGLAGIAGSVLPGPEGQGADWVRKLQSMLTYEPHTQAGKDASSVIGYLPGKLDQFADATGNAVSDATHPAVGAVVKAIMETAPSLIGAKGSSTLADAAGGTSTRLMQSALKPSVSAVRSGSAGRAVNTLLDEGINVTPGGAVKIGDRIDGLNDQIRDAIGNSSATVDKYSVANRLQDLIRQRELQADPSADVSAVTRVYDNFTQNHPLIPGNDIPVQLAQDIKKGTYQQLRDKYGEMGSAETEAQKGIARGLKEDIASAVPEVAPLNARESDLLNAKDLLDRRVAVSGNKNPIGLQAGVAPSVMKTVIGMLDRSELVKSLMARALKPGDLSLSDMTAVGATAPQTFSDDQKKRQAMIAALMGAK